MNQGARGGPAPERYLWYVVGVLMLVSILGYVDRLVLGFLVDPIKADLALSDTEVGVLTGFAFALFYVIMGLPLGRLIDTGNRRNILSLCIATWSAMTTACGLAFNFMSLFAARMGVASGEAGLNPSAISIISDLFPRERVALPISIFTLGIYIGGGLAIIIGGQLVDYFAGLGSVQLLGFEDVSAWRLVFFATGLPGLLVAALMFFTVREPRRSFHGQTDRAVERSLSDVWTYLKTHRWLYLLLFGGLFTFGFYLYAVLGWYPAMLLRTYGISAGEAAVGYGSVYLVCGVAGALSVGPLMRWFEKRGFRESAVMVCLAATSIMIVPSVVGPLMPTLTLCLACFAITKFCWAAAITVGFTAVAQITPNAMRGLMVSVYMAAMNVTGGAFGAVIVGLLSDHVFGAENIRYALAVSAALFIPLAAVIFAFLRPVYRRGLAELEAA